MAVDNELADKIRTAIMVGMHVSPETTAKIVQLIRDIVRQEVAIGIREQASYRMK